MTEATVPAFRDLASIAAFADALPVGIWVGVAPSGEVVYVNGAFEAILGMPPPEDAARGNYVAPYSVHTRTGDVYPENRMPFERAIAARATIEVDDLVIHRSDGTRVYLRVYARPLFGADGSVTHVVEAFTDITREVDAERARAEGDSRLRQAQRVESIGALAGGIAHDFNNLLATIRILSSQLRRSVLDPIARESVEDIARVVDSGVKLTQSLLGFARRSKSQSQRVSVPALIKNTAALTRRTIDSRIEIVTRMPLDPAEIMADPSQIEQVLMNLVLNARDAIAGSGRITLRCTIQEIGMADLVAHPTLAPGPHVVFEVSDTGAGIDPAIRDRIFEPYLTTKTSGSTKGTGLGLATVYAIVQSHQGAIDVLDNVPNGTTMRIFIPRVTPSLPPPSHEAAPIARILRGEGGVLLIEDEAAIRKAASAALGSIGYQVFEAENGVRGIELFRANAEKIVAVVLDMAMPTMGGRETYLQLRAIDPAVRVVLTTGYALSDEAQSILDLGVREFVPKPYDLETLSQTLARAIGAPP